MKGSTKIGVTVFFIFALIVSLSYYIAYKFVEHEAKIKNTVINKRDIVIYTIITTVMLFFALLFALPPDAFTKKLPKKIRK
jgi:uncharacterized BrkB/YihY/UPF0761 family membrane protein